MFSHCKEQRIPFMLLEIVNLRSGAVLDYNDGSETEDCLEIKVDGVADPEALVKVEGVPARRIDKRFIGTVFLKKKINQVIVTSSSHYGELSQILTLVWDKKAFKRYNFYIDDNSFFYTDLAKECPKRAFGHFYLAGLKEIHRKYGTLFTLNCFYHNDHFSFDMKDVPDCYKSEFEDNSDWLRLSFHAFRNFLIVHTSTHPQRSCLRFDLVKSEIILSRRKEFYRAVNVHGQCSILMYSLFCVSVVSIYLTRIPVWKNIHREADTKSRVCGHRYFYEKDVSEYIWARKFSMTAFSKCF